MKKILLIISAGFLLVSCGEKELVEPKHERKSGSHHGGCQKNDDSDNTTTTLSNERTKTIHNLSGGGGCSCGVTHTPPPKPVEFVESNGQ